MSDWNSAEKRHAVIVPAGYEIVYEAAPKRRYLIDGVEVQSVTEILRCLDKPALPWWGMNVGVAGVVELARRGKFSTDFPAVLDPKVDAMELAKIITSGLLTEEKLTVNHVRDKGGKRGASVHDAFERWSVSGEMPELADYPPEEQGYVCALLAFLHDMKTLTPEAVEVMVGSKMHGYAGRYDFRGHTTEPHAVVTKVYDKIAAKTITVPPGSCLLDLKTSKDVFGEQVLQLEGYEGASIEGGEEPTDYRAVIHVADDGRYQFRRSRSTHEDFLAIKACSEAVRRAEEGIKVKR